MYVNILVNNEGTWPEIIEESYQDVDKAATYIIEPSIQLVNVPVTHFRTGANNNTNICVYIITV